METCHGNLYLPWGTADMFTGALEWKDGRRKGLLQKNCKTINGAIWMSLGSKSWPFSLKGVFFCTSLINHVVTVVLQTHSLFHMSFLTVHAQQSKLLWSADHSRSHSKMLKQSPTGSLDSRHGQPRFSCLASLISQIYYASWSADNEELHYSDTK